MEEEYSKREIDVFMQEIRDTLQRIEAQTMKTNGRVSKLEIWRGFITGGLAILSALMVPIVVWAIENIIR